MCDKHKVQYGVNLITKHSFRVGVGEGSMSCKFAEERAEGRRGTQEGVMPSGTLSQTRTIAEIEWIDRSDV